MIYHKSILVRLFLLLLFANCSNKNKIIDSASNNHSLNEDSANTKSKKEIEVIEKTNPKEYFVPKNHVIYSEIYGDLNKDGVEDCILIIKDTKQENIVINRFDEEVDRNRRGIVLLFKKGNGYELATKNTNCFSSENEDGGVYYAPELDIRIEKGNVFIHYAHGRYGYWSYTFRYQNNYFELIGYDYSENFGPITQHLTSINFLTRKKLVKTNVSPQENLDEEIFESKWYKIKAEKLIKLSEIEDFDEISFEE